MNILHSPAGCEPVVGENKNLKAAIVQIEQQMADLVAAGKEKYNQRIKEMESPTVHQVAALSVECHAKHHVEYKLLALRLEKLKKAACEVCCPQTNFHVWAENEEEAILTWNKAVEKLDTLTAEDLDPEHLVDRVTACGFPVKRSRKTGRRFVPYDGPRAEVAAAAAEGE